MRYSKKWMAAVILIVFFAVNTQYLFAQDYKIERIGIPQGLPQGLISALCQDSDGFIWAGTLSGVSRYDGHTFKTFTHKANDPFSPSANIVTGILEDSKGRIWVSMVGGLDCYDRKTGRFYHLGNSFNIFNKKDELTQPRFETADGNIWLRGTTTVIRMTVPDDFPANLNKIKDIEYRVFTQGKGLPDVPGHVILYQLPSGSVGLTSGDNSAYKFNPKSGDWIRLSQKIVQGDPDQWVEGTIVDQKRQGNWILDGQSVLFINADGIKQTIPLNDHPAWTKKHSLNFQLGFVDDLGHIWAIGEMESKGFLLRIKPKSIGSTEPNQIEFVIEPTKKQIYKQIIKDSSGSIWLGSNGYGIIKIIPKPKSKFSSTLEDVSIRGIIPIPQTEQSVKILFEHVHDYDGTKLSPTVTFRFEGIERRISNFLQSKNNTQCFTFKTHTQYWLARKRLNEPASLFEVPEFSLSDPIFEDHDGGIWLWTSYGEIAFLPSGADSVVQFSVLDMWDSKEANISPKQIIQSVDRTFWVATHSGLLHVTPAGLNKPAIKIYQNDPKNPLSLSGNTIFSILEDPIDSENYLWVATNGAGLNKMNKKTGQCQHYTKKEGLPDNVVYGILADKHNRLWLSTNFGLSCFTPSKGHFWNFTAEDGLQDNEFNTRAFCKTPNGRLYFGGVNGLTTFVPEELTPEQNFSPVKLTGLKINNKTIEERDSSGILAQPIEYTEVLRLNHDQNFVTIVFNALNFQQKNSYFHKLDGVDKEWVFSGNHNEASYPNLSPGNYTLRIVNVNESGEWNPKETILNIRINFPWWRTWWAYLIYFLLIGFPISAFMRQRINNIKIEKDLLYKEKEAKALQELDEVKTRFFTNVTHEFRTPLTLILEPARQLLLHPDSLNAKEAHQIIFNNANRLLLLVNQLLDLSKLEDGKFEAYYSEENVHEIAQSLLHYFKPMAHKKNIQLNFTSNTKELTCITDRQMLEKIINNLLSNALKFTGENGTITIGIEEKDDQQWSLRVSDNGIGIPEDKIGQIFNRFFQADNSSTRKGEGTGIGLALVKEFTHVLQGKIEVESQLGQGSTFTLTFLKEPAPVVFGKNASKQGIPLDISEIPQSEPNPQPRPVNETENHRGTILLVEDNLEMRLFLRMILQPLGYAIHEAENGKIGLDMAQSIMPDLIITDLMMPEMDGFQLTKTLKNAISTSHIPTIILTAKSNFDTKIEGYRLGADAFLPKPFLAEELIVRIEQILENQKKTQRKFQSILLPNIESSVEPALVPVPEEVNDLGNGPTEGAPTEKDLMWLQELKSLILGKLTVDDFKIDDLAIQMAISRVQFFSKVKTLTGLTPSRFVREVRLEKARQLFIENKNTRVSEVAQAVGLSDTRTFTEAFKEKYGMTPQAFKKEHKSSDVLDSNGE